MQIVKERPKPRGFFTDQSHLAWSKDQSKNYFEGDENLKFWPLVKLAIVILVFGSVYFASGRLSAAFIVCIALTMYYPHAVALCMHNTKVIPTMDQATFASSEKSICNFAVMSFYDNDDIECMREKLAYSVRTFKKFRYKIKFIYGDPYYEEMSVEEALSKVFLPSPAPEKILRNQTDMEMYLEDNLNTKMPNDGPLIRFYLQRYEPDDQDHIEPDKRPKLLWLCRLHHSLCDGASSICVPLACSDEFDRSYFTRAQDATFLQRALIRIMLPFQIIPFLWMSAFRADKNTLTKKRDSNGLSGNINIAQAPGLDLEEIKQMAKARGATINDAILAGFLTSLHTVFKDVGEEIPRTIHVAMPANIRFKFYPSREKVKFENKFTALVVEAPLTPDFDLKTVRKITNRVKGSIGMIYAGYASQRQFAKLSPRAFVHETVNTLSSKTTAFFSNTPGCSRPLTYTNEKTGDVTTNTQAIPYIQPAGKGGLTLAACSWNGKYQISLNTDDNLLNREMCQKLMATMHSLIQAEIDKFKSQDKKTANQDTSTQVSDAKGQESTSANVDIKKNL